MIRNTEKLHNSLRKGFFLSSMMGISDGNFCSQRSEGCVMIQLGSYLAEPPAYGKQKYFLPDTINECVKFLRQECLEAKKVTKVFTCLNLATPKLNWGLDAAKCFSEAGGDFVELNVHGSYPPYLSVGKLRAMVLPENRDELYEWIRSFTDLDIPLIVKFKKGVVEDYSTVLDKALDFNLFGVHFNIRNEETKRPDFEFVQNVKRKRPFFLLVSGYVRSSEDAERLFRTGADMVGIAEPTITNPSYIYKIAKNIPVLTASRSNVETKVY